VRCVTTRGRRVSGIATHHPPKFCTSVSLLYAMSAIPVSEKPASHSLPTFLAPVSPLVNAYSRFSQWRTALDLPNPGTAENLQKEVKSA